MGGNKKSLFYKTFLGEFVDVITKAKIDQAMTEGDVAVKETTPIVLSGIMVDRDEEFLYLSDGMQINQAVKNSEIIAVTLHVEKEEKPSDVEEKDMN